MSTSRASLVHDVYSRLGIPQGTVDRVARELLVSIINRTAAGDRVEIRGFGTFYPHLRKARPAQFRVPGKALGACGMIMVPSHRVMLWKPSADLVREVRAGEE